MLVIERGMRMGRENLKRVAQRASLKFFGIMISIAVLSGAVQAGTENQAALQECIGEMGVSAPEDMTVGEMRTACKKKIASADETAPGGTQPGVVDQRVHIDRENVLKPFTLMAHKQNYILLGAHNFAGYSDEVYKEQFQDESLEIDDTEVQFQLSIKMPVAVDIFDSDVDIFAAYTMRSFWQLYNADDTVSGRDTSAPFRETNHEPELWVQTDPDFEIFGFESAVAALGFVHQSNGRGDVLSRSWNRAYAEFIFQRGNFAIGLKPWYRFQEDSEDDDNPDITDYLGHGEIQLAYKWNDHVFTLKSRNNLESGFSNGAVEFGWSFPLWGYPYFKGYVQYFSGYGESLIDYDKYVNRIGVGLLLTDLL